MAGHQQNRIAGCHRGVLGSIGTKIATALDQGIEGLTLSAVAVRDPDKHRPFLDGLRRLHPRCCQSISCPREPTSWSRLRRAASCVPSSSPPVRRGKAAVIVSVGALLEHSDLIDLAQANGGRIVVPTGALIGLDAVNAAAIGTIHSVKMVSRKPVAGLKGAPFIVQNNIDIDHLREPLNCSRQRGRGGEGLSANLNVAVALSLAGVGLDRTQVRIWADPTVTRNVHRIEVEADSARFSMSIENIPSENPKNGMIRRFP